MKRTLLFLVKISSWILFGIHMNFHHNFLKFFGSLVFWHFDIWHFINISGTKFFARTLQNFKSVMLNFALHTYKIRTFMNIFLFGHKISEMQENCKTIDIACKTPINSFEKKVTSDYFLKNILIYLFVNNFLVPLLCKISGRDVIN